MVTELEVFKELLGNIVQGYVGNLVFYTQSTILVISGQIVQRTDTMILDTDDDGITSNGRVFTMLSVNTAHTEGQMIVIGHNGKFFWDKTIPQANFSFIIKVKLKAIVNLSLNYKAKAEEKKSPSYYFITILVTDRSNDWPVSSPQSGTLCPALLYCTCSCRVFTKCADCN